MDDVEMQWCCRMLQVISTSAWVMTSCVTIPNRKHLYEEQIYEATEMSFHQGLPQSNDSLLHLFVSHSPRPIQASNTQHQTLYKIVNHKALTYLAKLSHIATQRLQLHRTYDLQRDKIHWSLLEFTILNHGCSVSRAEKLGVENLLFYTGWESMHICTFWSMPVTSKIVSMATTGPGHLLHYDVAYSDQCDHDYNVAVHD